MTLAREDAREVWTFAWIEHAWQDLALAVRGLRHSKTFTLVAVGTLALGIGANTALFSIFNSLLLRELPVREPARLVILDEGSWTYPIWQAVEAQTTSVFEGAFAYSNLELDLAVSGQRQPVDAAYASGGLFDVLGVTAIRGRLLQPLRRSSRRERPRGGDQPPLLAAALRAAPTARSAPRSRSIASPSPSSA